MLACEINISGIHLTIHLKTRFLTVSYNMEPIELTKFMTDLSVNKRTMQAILKKRQAWWDWAMGLVK